jgi:hypothetical protein
MDQPKENRLIVSNSIPLRAYPQVKTIVVIVAGVKQPVRQTPARLPS